MRYISYLIVCIVLLLLFVTTGKELSYPHTDDLEKATSTCYYQQQQSPLEKTLQVLYNNSLAGQPQNCCNITIHEHTFIKPQFHTLSNASHSEAPSIGIHLSSPFLFIGNHSIDYYIYTLHRILI